MVVETVFHGTTKMFKTLKVFNRKIGAGSYCGTGLYFTDNREDAIENYAIPSAADVNRKAEFIAENLTREQGDYYKVKTKILKKWIRVSRLITARVTINKPFYLSRNGSTPYVGGDGRRSFKRIRQYLQGMYDQNNGECFEDMWGELYMMLLEGCQSGKLWDYMFNKFSYIHDDSTNLYMHSEMAKHVVRLLGFDGIVQQNTYDYFRMLMQKVGDSNHYIVFRKSQVEILSDAILL